MYKSSFTFPFFILFFLLKNINAQNVHEFNLGFEKESHSNKGLPFNWHATTNGNYNFVLDSNESFNKSKSMYISSIDSNSHHFARLLYSIPLSSDGDSIELRGFIKYENVNGYVGFFMSIYGENELLAYETMREKDLNGSKDWREYSIKISLPKSAKVLSVGPLLSGQGKMWCDDLEVLIDNNFIARKYRTYEADKDHEFDQGSEIQLGELTPQKLTNLEKLCKIWGFLKYHHPLIAQGTYNWDYELLRVLPNVLNANNDDEFNQIIYSWVIGLGEIKTINSGNCPDVSETKFHYDYDWVNKNSLGSKLTNELIRIKNHRRTVNHYYLSRGIGHEIIFSNESHYENLTDPDVGFRLLALFRYWNIIEYFYPYKHLIQGDWENELKKFLPIFIKSSSALKYRLASLELVTAIGDRHAYITANDKEIFKYWGENVAPYVVNYLEEKPVVVDYYRIDEEKSYKLQKGDIILSVNDTLFKDFVKYRSKYTPASNEIKKYKDITLWDLLRTRDSILKVKYLRDEETYTSIISCYNYQKIGFFQKHYDKSEGISFEDSIAIINVSNLNEKHFIDALPGILKSRGIIIDYRGYPQVNLTQILGNHLFNKETAFCRILQGSIICPGNFSYLDSMKTVGKKGGADYFGRIVLLVNENTISSGEYQSMALRLAPTVTVIGNTTAAADGNVSNFKLPSGISARISSTGIYHPDGSETQQVGIIPDIYLEPTIQGVLLGKDELMERAKEFIYNK